MIGTIIWGSKRQVIYKHAISTITPIRPVDLAEDIS
jgi:sRNA-binding regulator protein Hfq